MKKVNLSNEAVSKVVKECIVNTYNPELRKVDWEDLAQEGTIYVTDLEEDMFLDNQPILRKYFHIYELNNSHKLDRFHMPEISQEEYEKYLPLFPTDNKANSKVDSATKYYKEKVFSKIVRDDFGIPEKYKISFSGYQYNSDYYMFYDYYDNRDWLENRFRDNEEERDGREIIRTKTVDIEIWNRLYNLCVKAIKVRLAMILEVPGIINYLMDILEYTNGLSTNCTIEMERGLQAKFNKLSKTIVDKELVKWVKAGNNDYTLFANEQCGTDYIETYHKMLWSLTSGNPEYLRESIHNEIDELEDLIFEDDINDHVIDFIENTNSDDEEYEEYEELEPVSC